jgi:voltage-gated potassium channel
VFGLHNLKRTAQNRIWDIVEVAKPGDKASRGFDIVILSLIALNVIASILCTVASIGKQFGVFFHWFEVVSVLVFSVEYLTRVISCTSDKKYSHSILGRLRFMITPMALIDLFAILPFYLSFFMIDLRAIRILRMIRIFRVAKMVRYSQSMQLIGSVFNKKREELVLISMVMFFLIVFSSSIMYYAEHHSQPEKYSDIPSTMWWAVVTLTTVGYGDITPVTFIGKMVAALIAISGIAMFAIPAGILGAGFVEELSLKRAQDSNYMKCPHCGKALDGSIFNTTGDNNDKSISPEIEKISEAVSAK